eukprot:TRINITY_DN32617_c0_g1_i1.p1 TRINITY_DN32617_c0_g1~~TRINITY_DN32617_c0_g1_i1.p1  ORF type:complete len:426 (+),score=175.97 TRINITY_DN32617_c0_g1_i1:86-1279(+)
MAAAEGWAAAGTFADLAAVYPAAEGTPAGHSAGEWAFAQWKEAQRELAAEREAALQLKCTLQQVESERNAYKSRFQGTRAEAASAKLETQAAGEKAKKLEERVKQEEARYAELERKLNSLLEEQALAVAEQEAEKTSQPTGTCSPSFSDSTVGRSERALSSISVPDMHLSMRAGIPASGSFTVPRASYVRSVASTPPPEPYESRLVRGALPDYATSPASDTLEVVTGALKTVKRMSAEIEAVMTSKKGRVSQARVVQLQEESLFACTLLHQSHDMIVFVEDIARNVTSNPNTNTTAPLPAKQAAALLNEALKLHKTHHQVASKAKTVIGKLRGLLIEGGHHGPLAVAAPPRYQRSAGAVARRPTDATAPAQQAPVDDVAAADSLDDDDYFGTYDPSE